MENIRDVIKKKDTCVISLIMFYESKGKNPIILYRLLSCILYSFIDNYVCIDYLCCKSKTLSRIYSDRIFEQTSYNILIGIGIPEVLLNLVSCHGFAEKPNSTVILNFQYLLVNNYLEKGFFTIVNNSKKLSSIMNDVKLRIHAIDKLETCFVMAKNTAFSLVSNTIKKLYIQSDLHFIYKKTSIIINNMKTMIFFINTIFPY